MNATLLPARDYLNLCQTAITPILDVRAPVEYVEGHIPLSHNAPILTDEERHLVGLAYKNEGNETATRLGHSLVTPHKAARVAEWIGFLQSQPTPVLTCWRGGERSRIAQEWIKEAGISALRMQGGYKALRHELLNRFSVPFTGFSLSGLTGSGKTEFIRSLNHPAALDLEAYANHRGSAFGGHANNPQPAQATFENALGLALVRAHSPERKILMESESRLIGKVVIPSPFFERMRAVPRLILETSWPERTDNIFREYVLEPLKKIPQEEHKQTLISAVDAIRERLGGLKHSEVRKMIDNAFSTAPEKERHSPWIEALFKHYYDPMYEYALKNFGGQIIFRGTAPELKHWLTKQADFFVDQC